MPDLAKAVRSIGEILNPLDGTISFDVRQRETLEEAREWVLEECAMLGAGFKQPPERPRVAIVPTRKGGEPVVVMAGWYFVDQMVKNS